MTKHLQKQRALFTLAHHDYKEGMNYYASFKVSNSVLSEDLVQDAFIKTWSYLAKGGDIEKMKAFLYHILNGLIIDEYRKRKIVSLDMLLEGGLEVPSNTTDQLINSFDGKIAISLINKLPKEYQKVMRMRYLQDLSLTEMSKLTGKTKNTIAVHAHRGLEKLRILYNREQVTSVV